MNFLDDKRTRAFFLAALGVIGIIFIFVFKPAQNKWIYNQGAVWNTEYHITYFHTDDLSDSIIKVLREYELSISPFNKESLITKINNNETDSLDFNLVQLYNKSKEINMQTNGAFDPTLAPIINAWGFGYKNNTLPTQTALDSMMQFVGIQKTNIKDGRLVKDDNRMEFNFSAIAKGLGVDRIGELLARNGIEDYMIEIGGEIVVKGMNSKGKDWRISIDRPTENDSVIDHNSAAIVTLKNEAIATSGNYRNFKTDSIGAKYNHIIDPKTGTSAKSDVLSATIIAKDCMTADAYATAFMIISQEERENILKMNPDMKAMIISSDSIGNYNIWTSSNIAK